MRRGEGGGLRRRCEGGMEERKKWNRGRDTGGRVGKKVRGVFRGSKGEADRGNEA